MESSNTNWKKPRLSRDDAIHINPAARDMARADPVQYSNPAGNVLATTGKSQRHMGSIVGLLDEPLHSDNVLPHVRGKSQRHMGSVLDLLDEHSGGKRKTIKRRRSLTRKIKIRRNKSNKKKHYKKKVSKSKSRK